MTHTYIIVLERLMKKYKSMANTTYIYVHLIEYTLLSKSYKYPSCFLLYPYSYKYKLLFTISNSGYSYGRLERIIQLVKHKIIT